MWSILISMGSIWLKFLDHSKSPWSPRKHRLSFNCLQVYGWDTARVLLFSLRFKDDLTNLLFFFFFFRLTEITISAGDRFYRKCRTSTIGVFNIPQQFLSPHKSLVGYVCVEQYDNTRSALFVIAWDGEIPTRRDILQQDFTVRELMQGLRSLRNKRAANSNRISNAPSSWYHGRRTI